MFVIFCWYILFVSYGYFSVKINLLPQLRDDGHKILMLSVYLIIGITKFSLEGFKLSNKIGWMYHRKVYVYF